MTFEEVFVGSELSYGLYQDELKPPKLWTVKGEGPAPPSAYKNHLAGRVGLGLVPVRKNGTCRFATIDVDFDTIDHVKLYKEVKSRKLPLSVCRSKSGGAHLYLFVREPGIKAAEVIALLKKWRCLLGLDKLPGEIFPKQLEVSAANTGNWIRLPYYGSDKTTRYVIGADGMLPVAGFLQ